MSLSANFFRVGRTSPVSCTRAAARFGLLNPHKICISCYISFDSIDGCPMFTRLCLAAAVVACTAGSSHAQSCAELAQHPKRPLPELLSFVRDCENRVARECAKSKGDNDLSCRSIKIGDKSSIRPLFSPTCRQKADQQKLEARARVALLRNCESDANSLCSRAATALGLAGTDAARFTSNCRIAAAG